MAAGTAFHRNTTSPQGGLQGGRPHVGASWDERFFDELAFRAPVRAAVRLRGFFRLASGLRGTLPPFSRASLSPMAIACLRLFTVAPEPLFSVPRFRRRIADSTVFEAF